MQQEKEDLERQEQKCQTEIDAICLEKSIPLPKVVIPPKSNRTGNVAEEHVAFEHVRKGKVHMARG